MKQALWLFTILCTSAVAQSNFSFSTIDFPGASLSDAFGINNAGQIVGTYAVGNFPLVTFHGFLLQSGTACDANKGNCVSIDFPGADATEASGINNSGQIVGSYNGIHGYLLSDDRFTTIDFPSARQTRALGINDAGDIVGFYFDSSFFQHGFLRLPNGSFTTIDFPGARGTQVSGINNDGIIVGNYFPGNHGFQLMDGHFTTLDPCPPTGTMPTAINNKGQIVGGCNLGTESLLEGFLFSKGAPSFLKFPHASATIAFGINDSSTIVGFFVSSSFPITQHGFFATAGCQVSVDRLSQCTRDSVGHWGGKPYAFHGVNGPFICGLGCYLTSLTMALNTININTIPTCFDTPIANDPGHLNDFMTCNASLLRYTFSTVPNDDNNVDPFVTTRDLGSHLQAMGLLQASNNLTFQVPAGSLDSSVDDAGTRMTLDNALCAGHPLIVRVTHCRVGTDGVTINCGPHFVLVDGKQGDEYTIADPSPDNRSLLSGYLRDPLALTADPDEAPFFQIRGFVKDPQGDSSELNVSVGDNAELLLIDPDGNHTGFDPSLGSNLRQIPQSTHFVDAVINDDNGAPPIGKSHLVDVFQPSNGTFTLVVTGLKLGQYTIGMRVYSQDGSAQPALMVSGISALGSNSSFAVEVSTIPGSSTSVNRIATFKSMLEDVNNGFLLGFIDDKGIANSLSKKLQAAQDSSGQARNNVLNAFKNEVNAQSGHHIIGVLPKVLIEDANSLLALTAP